MSDYENKIQSVISHYRNIIAMMPGHVYWKDKNGVLQGCNKSLAKTLGFSNPKDIIGKTDYDLATKEEAESIRAFDFKVIQSGKEESLVENYILPNGEIAAYLTRKTPLRDEENRIIGILGISIDITEQKNLEKQLSETKVREAHFKAMSSLGGMIAHELRTPLASLKIGLTNLENDLETLFQAYKTDLKLQPEKDLQIRTIDGVGRRLARLQRAVLYADTTITTVLTGLHESVSKLPAKREPFLLSTAMDTAQELYPQASQAPAHLQVDIPDIEVIGDMQIVVHTLLNLLKNAYHAIQVVGEGEIRVTVPEQDEKQIILSVEDTGAGIPEDVLPHIFEPFFTTKEESAASVGLGLYFCQLSLEKMGAEIHCESKPGHYTRFLISLPRAAKTQ